MKAAKSTGTPVTLMGDGWWWWRRRGRKPREGGGRGGRGLSLSLRLPPTLFPFLSPRRRRRGKRAPASKQAVYLSVAARTRRQRPSRKTRAAASHTAVYVIIARTRQARADEEGARAGRDIHLRSSDEERRSGVGASRRVLPRCV